MEGRNVRLQSQQRIELRPDVPEIVAALVENIMALAALMLHSNRDSNSLGGILIHPPSTIQVRPRMNPRRKARKEYQPTGELSGDLTTYEKFGLFQRTITRRTA